MLRAIARLVIPAPLRGAMRRGLGMGGGGLCASDSYGVFSPGVPVPKLDGWQDPDVAERQFASFASLLRDLRAGRPRRDFLAVAEAVRLTGLPDPFIIEAGCGSGWNAEVLTCLLGRPAHYVGLDYSLPMIAVGRRHYPEARFVAGDATALPFADGACDILLSGTVLMHLPEYPKAIAESRRVARAWCVFHTVPVLQRRRTTVLRKRAYGQWTIEVVFNEQELRERLESEGMAIRHVLDSTAYDLRGVLGEATVTKTYVCEVTA